MRFLEWFRQAQANAVLAGTKYTLGDLAAELSLSRTRTRQILDGAGCQMQTATRIVELTDGAVSYHDLAQGPDASA